VADLNARIPLIRVTAMPADTNPYGGLFGGWLMMAFKELVA